MMLDRPITLLLLSEYPVWFKEKSTGATLTKGRLVMVDLECQLDDIKLYPHM